MRCYEKSNSKFAVGTTGNKKSKFVEADKGTNLFFAVYEHTILNKGTNESEKERLFVTIPLKMVIDCQKSEGKNWLPHLDVTLKENEMMAADAQLLFILSPNDLIYLPTDEELKNGVDIAHIDKNRIYKMVSCSEGRAFFIIETVAKSIVDKVEFSSLNKMERAITGEIIRHTCILVKVDRLGNIVEFNGKPL